PAAGALPYRRLAHLFFTIKIIPAGPPAGYAVLLQPEILDQDGPAIYRDDLCRTIGLLHQVDKGQCYVLCLAYPSYRKGISYCLVKIFPVGLGHAVPEICFNNTWGDTVHPDGSEFHRQRTRQSIHGAADTG